MSKWEIMMKKLWWKRRRLEENRILIKSRDSWVRLSTLTLVDKWDQNTVRPLSKFQFKLRRYIKAQDIQDLDTSYRLLPNTHHPINKQRNTMHLGLSVKWISKMDLWTIQQEIRQQLIKFQLPNNKSSLQQILSHETTKLTLVKVTWMNLRIYHLINHLIIILAICSLLYLPRMCTNFSQKTSSV